MSVEGVKVVLSVNRVMYILVQCRCVVFGSVHFVLTGCPQYCIECALYVLWYIPVERVEEREGWMVEGGVEGHERCRISSTDGSRAYTPSPSHRLPWSWSWSRPPWSLHPHRLVFLDQDDHHHHDCQHHTLHYHQWTAVIFSLFWTQLKYFGGHRHLHSIVASYILDVNVTSPSSISSFDSSVKTLLIKAAC